MTAPAAPDRLRPVLRPATPADAGAVAALLEALGYPCSREDAAQRIAVVEDDPTQTLLVADHHGDLCGLLALDFMYYLPLGRRTCRITALVVAEDHRDRGIGRALLREAERRARAAGAARIEVTSADHRTRAHAFYRACGYGGGSVRLVKRLGEA
ncbi:MAG: GNAT family N-acetyltransferase [Rehaibacterium terrae]|uniref:GNAT family N-acetyltransferase n=1 Tax=Rehaibacterium terrae TaxID=1341696 RepID=UPI00391A6CF5